MWRTPTPQLKAHVGLPAPTCSNAPPEDSLPPLQAHSPTLERLVPLSLWTRRLLHQHKALKQVQLESRGQRSHLRVGMDVGSRMSGDPRPSRESTALSGQLPRSFQSGSETLTNVLINLDGELRTSTFVRFRRDVGVREARRVSHLQAHSLRYSLIRQLLLLHLGRQHPPREANQIKTTAILWRCNQSEGGGGWGEGGTSPCRTPSV